MHLTTLATAHFRNLSEVRISPHRRFNILEGRNGQGKTNLLEAVYLLSAFRTFRDGTNRDIIEFGQDSAQIYAEIVRRDVKRSVEIRIGSKGKQVSLDGKTITRLPAQLAHLNCVIFGPDDLSMTKGGPALRRQFIDRAAYAIWPDYVTELRGYQSALKSRNQLLKSGGPVDPAFLEAFERELVRWAARVLHRRLLLLRTFRPHFVRIFSAITDEELTGSIRYKGFADLEETMEVEDLEAGYRAALVKSQATDLRRGFTSVGPHTDDLVFGIDKRTARKFASQGQHRAFVLALKIAELERIRESIGVYPVFLLDDVSSELDERRNASLMEYLDRAGGQVFITTTDRRWIKVSADSSVFKVDAGTVVAVGPEQNGV
ncbi:MAG: DNA replication and repair protein RecF [Myxococcota bacterium]